MSPENGPSGTRLRGPEPDEPKPVVGENTGEARSLEWVHIEGDMERTLL